VQPGLAFQASEVGRISVGPSGLQWLTRLRGESKLQASYLTWFSPIAFVVAMNDLIAINEVIGQLDKSWIPLSVDSNGTWMAPRWFVLAVCVQSEDFLICVAPCT